MLLSSLWLGLCRVWGEVYSSVYLFGGIKSVKGVSFPKGGILYTGIQELILTDDLMANLYNGSYVNNELFLNQYLIIKDSSGNVVDTGRWTEKGFTKLKYKPINNDYFGKISPRNQEQTFAFDALENDSITGVLLTGGFGSGKTMCSLVYAIDQITRQTPKYDRIVYLRNNYDVFNTISVGALPGNLNEKLAPYAMSLADILGSVTQLNLLISTEKIVLDHIGFIRGRSFKNSLVLLSEAQNTSREIMALIVARIGTGSRLIVEGDVRQCDKEVFAKNSGIYYLAESLRGDPEFAMITLKKNERSRFASLSDKILGIEE